MLMFTSFKFQLLNPSKLLHHSGSRALTRRLFETQAEENKNCYVTKNEKGICVINLSRPNSKNAISVKLLQELQQSISQIRNEPTARVAIVRSRVEGVFCAGADLKERLGMTPSEVTQFLNRLKQTFIDLENLPIPTIAAIDGAALGGGLELALSCDMRVAGPKSIIGLPETSLGIIPGAGGTQRLINLVGVSKAKELIFTGEKLNTAKALQLGILNNAVYEKSDSCASNFDGLAATLSGYDLAVQLAEKISTKGPIAIQMAKQAINLGSQTNLMDGLNIEQLCYNRVIGTEDRIEGLKAFKEKRAPIFKGK
ncbi:hypothetical protein BB561_005602 [Smittium simulii]|uniref:Enoyl-CoA hydratase n=1 Tax=Smittium simulii TaxID=133385 RepID=A0A2T9Y9N2_9FUNG|nr:hypothetical protein BB561_005602 [Smittium simulii]